MADACPWRHSPASVSIGRNTRQIDSMASSPANVEGVIVSASTFLESTEPGPFAAAADRILCMQAIFNLACSKTNITLRLLQYGICETLLQLPSKNEVLEAEEKIFQRNSGCTG